MYHFNILRVAATKVKGIGMTEPDERALLAGALRSYLEDLKDTGVDALPLMESQPVIANRAEPVVVAMNTMKETLEDIRTGLGECRRCQLCECRTNIVFGAGSQSAEVLFIGGAPGEEEDLQSEPFGGEAGQLLTKMIKAMGYERHEVYISTVLKCRPPADRTPVSGEISQCSPFLLRQISALAPKVIVTLGTLAAQTLLNSNEPLSSLRGRWHDYYSIPLMATFQPSFLLSHPEKKREAWTDLQQVMKLLVK